jgi:uncharacterized membrane protein
MPVLFVILGGVLGLLYLIAMPPLQVPDERGHLVREYSLSTGACVPPTDYPAPKSFEQFFTLYPSFAEFTRRLSFEDLRTSSHIPLNDGDRAANVGGMVGFAGIVASSCVPYLPAGAALTVGRHLALSPLALMYLARLANLAVYLLLVFVALKLMPDFKLLLFCLALMPMSLHQAASVSVDSMTIAVSFLFCAYAFRLAFGEDPAKLELRHHLAMAALLIAIALSKSVIALGLLTLLIPARKFGSGRSRWLAVAGYALVLAASLLLWQYANRANLYRLNEFKLTQGINIAENLRFLYREPAQFAAVFGRTVAARGLNFVMGFVGVLGQITVPLPGWLIVGYYALLLLAVAQARAIRLGWPQRLLLAVVVALNIAAVILPLWTWETGTAYAEQGFIGGIQGRYFIPFSLPAFVLLSNARMRFPSRYLTLIAAGFILAANLVAVYAVLIHYYPDSF